MTETSIQSQDDSNPGWLKIAASFAILPAVAFFVLFLGQELAFGLGNLLLNVSTSIGLTLIGMSFIVAATLAIQGELNAKSASTWLPGLLFIGGILSLGTDQDTCVSADRHVAMKQKREAVLNQWNKCVFREDKNACSDRWAAGDLIEIDRKLEMSDICSAGLYSFLD